VTNGTLNESVLDLSEIFKNRDQFTSYLKKRMALPAEPTYDRFCEWADGVSNLDTNRDAKTYWLVTSRDAVKLGKPVYQILSLALEQKLTIAQLFEGSSLELTNALIEYFTELEAKGLLSFVAPGQTRWDRFSLADERIVSRATDSELYVPIGKLDRLAHKPYVAVPDTCAY